MQFREFGGIPRFAGPIRTVRVFQDNVLVRRLLESSGEGAVLVVDGGGSLGVALVGDRLAELGRENGWSGLIVYGAVRDVQQLHTLQIGIKALGSNPMKSAKTGAGEVDVPVSFGSTSFIPGEYVYCDEDGILISSAALF